MVASSRAVPGCRSSFPVETTPTRGRRRTRTRRAALRGEKRDMARVQPLAGSEQEFAFRDVFATAADVVSWPKHPV